MEGESGLNCRQLGEEARVGAETEGGARPAPCCCWECLRLSRANRSLAAMGRLSRSGVSGSVWWRADFVGLQQPRFWYSALE